VVAGACSTSRQRGSEEQREFGRRTRGGGAHHEAEVATMVAQKAVGSGKGAATGADERPKERGGVLVVRLEGGSPGSASTWGKEKKGGGGDPTWRWQPEAAGNSPRPSGVGGAVAARTGEAASVGEGARAADARDRG
jgi:hypothetical protein